MKVSITRLSRYIRSVVELLEQKAELKLIAIVTFSSLTLNTKKRVSQISNAEPCKLWGVIRLTIFENPLFLLTMENSLCFCVRLRGICVPHTLWWALNSLTLIQRDHDIVRLREMTWHCKISQIRSVRGWFEIQYAMTHKNKFKYMYLLIQLHNSLLKM